MSKDQGIFDFSVHDPFNCGENYLLSQTYGTHVSLINKLSETRVNQYIIEVILLI